MICKYCNSELYSAQIQSSFSNMLACYNCEILFSYNTYYIFSKEKVVYVGKNDLLISNVESDNMIPKYYVAITEKYASLRKYNFGYKIINCNYDILSKITPQNIDQKIKTILTFI